MRTIYESRIRIFPKNWERILLFLGILPIVFAVWNPGWITERWELQFVSNLLFLNLLHTCFSLYIIWRSEEVQLAIRRNTDGRPWRLHLRSLTVFTFSFIAYDSVLRPQASDATIFAWTFICAEFLSIHHGASQQLGLSFLYDHAQKKFGSFSVAELNRFDIAAKWERIFHYVVLAGVVIAMLGGGSNWFASDQPPMDSQWLSWGQIILTLGTIGLLGTIVARPQWYRSNKWIFNLRRIWLVWSRTTILNPTFIAFRVFNHGFEYLAVTASIDRNTKKSRHRVIDIVVFFGLCAICGYCYLHYIVLKSGPTPFDTWVLSGPLTPIIATLSASFTITHYYYDSQIFRFSKAEFRDNVLPLLTPNETPVSIPIADSRPSRSSTM